MSHTTRIAKNTLALYFRQILIMLVSLYTVRVVLAMLGAEDYGIYNVVAGVVTMFGFLSNSMATATQRYLAFELGRGEPDRLEKVFSLSLTIYALIAFLILFLAETVGLWFVYNRLVIPVERKSAAVWAYQCAVVSFLFTILTAPYMAALIAQEDMNVYAYVSIGEAALKLGIIFVLSYAVWDKLKLYGILMCAITGINTAAYRIICVTKHHAYRFRFYWDRTLFKEITEYTGWSLFGSVSSIVKDQGINILLNIYFGPIVNTARAVAMQVHYAVFSFAQNFSTAVRPQIVKLYAGGNKREMLRLVFRASKGTYFLLFVIFLPLELELPMILTLWIREIPDYVLAFTRIVLINALMDSISHPLMGASQATGKIGWYQLTIGGIQIMNFPLCLYFLAAGGSPVTAPVIGAFLAVIAYLARVLILSRQLEFSLWTYAKGVFLPVVFASVVGGIVPLCFVRYYPVGLARLFLTVFISVVSMGMSVFFVGLSKNERLIFINIAKNRITGLSKR